MKIKHWQGYGCVSAKKLSVSDNNNIRTLKIRVEGNHEYGIETDDEYRIAHWLVERFDKKFEYSPRAISYIKTTPGYADDGKTERCDYEIRYNTPKGA